MFEEPLSIVFLPLILMTETERSNFESPFMIDKFPEVGSVAMQRVFSGEDIINGWIIVQEGRYRYTTTSSNGVIVRIVFSEYLACEIIWEN